MLRYLRAVAITTVISTLIVPSWAANDEKIDFKLKLAAGKTYRLELTNRSTFDVSIRNRHHRIDETTVAGVELLLESTDQSGVMRTKVTFGNWSHQLEQDGLLGDPEDPDNIAEKTATDKCLKLLSGRSFTAFIMPNGTVKSLEGLTELKNYLMMNIADLKGHELTEAEHKISGMINTLGLSMMLEGILGAYPSKPVGIGERWVGEAEEQSDVPCLMQPTSKVTERKDGELTIKLFRDYRYDPDPTFTSSEDLILKLIVNGNLGGSALYDEQTGLVINSSVSGKLTGKLTLLVSEGSARLPVTVTISESVVQK